MSAGEEDEEEDEGMALRPNEEHSSEEALL